MAEKDIIAKLDVIDDKLDKSITWQEVHDKSHEAIEEKVEEVRHTLYHNPGGLKSQVQRLCNGKKALKRWQEFAFSIGQRLISWAVIAVIIWLLVMYKGH